MARLKRNYSDSISSNNSNQQQQPSKRIKLFNWFMQTINKPKVPYAPPIRLDSYHSNKSSQRQSQIGGGGIEFNNRNSPNRTQKSVLNLSTNRDNRDRERDKERNLDGPSISRINNNKQSTTFPSKTFPKSLSTPLQLPKIPSLSSPPSNLLQSSSSSSSRPIQQSQEDEIAIQKYLANEDYKWQVASAQAAGKPIPIRKSIPNQTSPGSTFQRKRVMGTAATKEPVNQRLERELQKVKEEKRQQESRYQDGNQDTLAAYSARVAEATAVEDARASFETSRNLPSNILSRPHSTLSRKINTPHAELNKALRIAQETKNTPKPPKPILEAYDALKSTLAEVEKSYDSMSVRRRKFPKALSKEDQDTVNAIFQQRGVISTTTGAEVIDKDIRKLRGLDWLNDEVITFYAIMINNRSNRIEKEGTKREKEEYRNCYSFTSFFYAKLSLDGHKGVARWSKKVDLFAKDKIIIPINQGNQHWVCSAIDIKKKRFEFYDSLGRNNLTVFKRLRDYLATEHLIKKKTELDLSDWTDHYDYDNTPLQANGCDCGVFTCQFMETLSRKVDNFDFTQAEMPYFRNRMVLDIKEQSIREEEWA